MDSNNPLSPEARAFLGLAGILPVLPVEEYLRLTRHYGQSKRCMLAKRNALARQHPVSFDLSGTSNPLSAIQYALDRLFQRG